MKVLDLKTNKLVDDYFDIENKVSAGEYAFEKGDIEVVSPSGEKGVIPSANIKDAFKTGFKYYTPLMKKEDELKKEYGEGIGAEVAAGGLGAARGITFGISDQILTKLDLLKPEAIKAYRDLNPTSSLLGEIGGTVGPALLSGGSSLLAKGAAKTLPSLALKGGMGAGKIAAKGIQGKIANKAVSKIVENTTKAGVGSAVEGALYGTGQLISEDALGDAEFNAENLLAYGAEGAAYGGLIGGAIPLVGSAIGKVAKGSKRVIDKNLLKQLGVKNADDIIERNAQNQEFESIIETIQKKEYPNIVKAGETLGIEPTQGMLSSNKLIQDLESSISQAPTYYGGKVATEVDAVYDGLSGAIGETVGDIAQGQRKSLFEAGESIKTNLSNDLNEKISGAKKFYKELDETFGSSPVSIEIKDGLKKDLLGSNANRLFKSKDVESINSMIDAIESVSDAKTVRTYIGKEMSAAYRAGDFNKYEIFDTAYDSITKLREDAIRQASGNSEEIINGLNRANKSYAGIFKDFGDVAKALKIGKIKGVSHLEDALNAIEPEKVAQRFFSNKNFSNNAKLKELFPESFETARQVKLGDIWDKSQTPKGEISVRKFVNNIKKLGKEESDLIFGADKRETLEAIETLANSIPDKVGPSGTAQAQDLFNFFSIYTQGRDAIRYALYRKGEKGINKYLNETVDVFKNIERSSNQAKVAISDSVESFIKGTSQVPTIAMLNAGESRNYDQAIKYLAEYELQPEETLEKITGKNKMLFDNAPKTSEAFAGKTMQVFQFLKEKQPASYDGMGYFNKYQTSKSEKMKFMRYYNYANDPKRVFSDLKNGFVRPEGVETMRTLYPRMYEELYNEITSRVAEKEDLTYKQKKNLYNMLSIVGASSLIPDNLKMLQGQMQETQETVKAQTNQNKNNLRVTGLREVSQADRFKTKLDKIS
jgi:hypothetical protein